MSYDRWKTRSPDDDLEGSEEPTHEKSDWEDEMQQLGVIGEVAIERQRQVAKGYDAAHDDEHKDGSIALAAAAYALHPLRRHIVVSERSGTRLLSLRDFWPWDWDQFKPENQRAALVKAAAMLVAEIERMDRAAAAQPDTWYEQYGDHL